MSHILLRNSYDVIKIPEEKVLEKERETILMLKNISRVLLFSINIIFLHTRLSV